MSKVVVVGGGVAGVASALRLAKLNHTVTLIDRNDRVGGALLPVEEGGYSWTLTGDAFTLPATLRDLFKKSGRPLDKELDLIELPVLREHRFADGTRVALPGQSRSGVNDALEALGRGLGKRWLEWTDSHSESWELLRRQMLERRYAEEYAPRELRKLVGTRTSLGKATKSLRDPRLREIATYHAVTNGQSPDELPEWFGVLSHVEQTFGAWAVPGGGGRMVELLERRLRERHVDVLTRTTVTDVNTGHVRIANEVIDADAIVVACDPTTLPSLAHFVAGAVAAPAPDLHLLAVEQGPDVPHQVVLHLPKALVTVDTLGPGPIPGSAAWTVAVRGDLGGDVLDVLARNGLPQAATVMRTIPGDELPAWLAGSPYGVRWKARKARQLGALTPLPGVYAAGAHTTISASTPFVVLTSSLVAAEFDKVPLVARDL